MTEYWLDKLETVILEIRAGTIGLFIGLLYGYIRGRWEKEEKVEEGRNDG